MSGLDLSLLRPLWLLALPVIAALGWYLRRRHGGIGDWNRAANPALLAALAALGRIEQGQDRRLLYALLGAAGVIVVALSGPAVERRDTTSFRNLDGVVFAIDASRSVTEDARWPQVSTMARFGVASLGTRPGGLVVFAGDAYAATDMTRDLRQLGQTLSLIDADTVPDPGSRPERGLETALRMLEEAEVLAGDVVLVTDGAGLGPASLRASEAIAARGARLSLIAAGDATPQMQAHAALGQGRVFTLSDTDAFANWLSANARDRLERQDYPLLFWRDYGRFALILALVPLLMLFRRRTA